VSCSTSRPSRSGAASIAVLANPNRPSYKLIREAIEATARAKGRRLVILELRGGEGLRAGIRNACPSARQALLVTSDPLYLDRRLRLVALVAQHSVPTVYAGRE
jgi:hypothetical protein